MDVVSHLAFGRALVALAHPPADSSRLNAPSRRALTAAIIVGAIAPDVDALLMPFGWDRYLVWHARGTHTLFGIVIVAALLASLIRFVVQPLLRRPRTPWRLVWLAAIVGCSSHLLLDAICGGSLHLLWPLSDAPLSFSLIGMADPLLAIPLLLFLIVASIWHRRAFALAVALLIAMGGVLGAKAVSRRIALHEYKRAIIQTREPPTRSTPPVIEGRWASLTEWFVYDRTDANVRAWRIDARTGRIELYVQHPTGPAPLATNGMDIVSLTEASRHLDTVKRALSLFDFTFPDVIARPDGTFDVLWSDIRYCRPSACDLRFGGRFDRTGRALEQVVIIGTVRQVREP